MLTSKHMFLLLISLGATGKAKMTIPCEDQINEALAVFGKPNGLRSDELIFKGSPSVAFSYNGFVDSEKDFDTFMTARDKKSEALKHRIDDLSAKAIEIYDIDSKEFKESESRLPKYTEDVRGYLYLRDNFGLGNMGFSKVSKLMSDVRISTQKKRDLESDIAFYEKKPNYDKKTLNDLKEEALALSADLKTRQDTLDKSDVKSRYLAFRKLHEEAKSATSEYNTTAEYPNIILASQQKFEEALDAHRKCTDKNSEKIKSEVDEILTRKTILMNQCKRLEGVQKVNECISKVDSDPNLIRTAPLLKYCDIGPDINKYNKFKISFTRNKEIDFQINYSLSLFGTPDGGHTFSFSIDQKTCEFQSTSPRYEDGFESIKDSPRKKYKTFKEALLGFYRCKSFSWGGGKNAAECDQIQKNFSADGKLKVVPQNLESSK